MKKSVTIRLLACMLVVAFVVPTMCVSGLAASTDVFSASNFVDGIMSKTDAAGNVIESSNLTGTTCIKVICSSRLDENSYSSNRYAVNHWCLGSGYNYQTNTWGTILADTTGAGNGDGKVSLHELYTYAYNAVASNINQHMVCYPTEDAFIIFE